MKVLSLFSGVGGFDLGLENAGMETVFQCEWDKHATSVLQRHWPDVPRWGDITTLTGRHILDHAPVIDVVAWGSPCQDLSVAGKRAGLSGERSGLFHEGIRIIKELRKETNNAYPRISIWENVYGALNSNKGADFGLVLNEMAEAGAMVIEWRVLDAQYFGVPQRRRRVFVIAIFNPRIAANCPDPLLPLRQGVRWNPATSRTTRQTTTRTTQESFGNSGFQRWSETDTAVTLSTRDYKGSMTMVVEQNRLLGSDIVGALNAVDYKWPQNQQLGDNKFVVQPFVKAKRAQSTTDDETLIEPTVFQPGTMTRLGGGVWEGTVPTLRAEVKRGDNEPHIMTEPAMSVRRLTPLECERLMGWPDGWTEGQADTHRYKQCGNGVASPVAQWIGEQILNIPQ